MKKPHIILFNPDQWRGDACGFLGAPGVQTPQLNRLVAGEAVAFADAHCQYPVCTPSRCCFMTGWYPHTFGHRDQHHMVQDPAATILGQLRAAGYRTVWCGKNDLLPGERGLTDVVDYYHRCQRSPYPLYAQTRERRGPPGNDGYYSFFTGKVEDRSDAPVAMDHDHQQVRAAVAQIEAHDPAQPLCLYLALHNPHPPYGVEEPFFSAIDRAAVPVPLPAPADWTSLPAILPELHRRHGLGGWSAERFRELRAVYYGMIRRVDSHLETIVTALRRKGLWDDSALFVFSDHGDHAGDYGLVQKDHASLRPTLTNVPFIVKPPREVGCRPGIRRHPTELTDLSATVYDLAGIQALWRGYGRSVVPCLNDPGHTHRDAAFCEGGHRLDDPRYRHPAKPDNLYWPTQSIESEALPANGPAVLCRTTETAYIRRQYGGEELYDLRSDPWMLHNRASAGGAQLAAMRERVLSWYLATSDAVPPTLNRREP